MKIWIKNKLIISDPTDEVRQYCKNELVMNNPDYYKKERMGKWTGNIPEKIYLYEDMGNELHLPFGCLKDIWMMHRIKEDYLYDIKPIEGLKYESSIKLYSYQEEAVQGALKGKNGVLVMPCGAGKTQSGLEIIARIGGKALWLTHTSELLHQSRDRANAVFDNVGLGLITAGHVNIGSHITFATVQTMARLNLSEYRDMWDVIIVDEAHHCCGSPTKVTQFYKVVNSLSARYKIGLTATPKRTDGLQQSMFKLLGGKLYEVTKRQIIENTCPVKVIVAKTGYQPDYNAVLQSDGTIDYNKLIDAIVHDEERLSMIMGVTCVVDGPTMILANRVEYLERINWNLNLINRSVCLSGKGQSKKAKEERRAALAALNNGELDFICATYQLAKEGLDVPNLRYIIFATPEHNETTVVQAVGRVERKAEGKEFGTVIDLVDDFGMYYGWANERKRYYKKIGAAVVDNWLFDEVEG